MALIELYSGENISVPQPRTSLFATGGGRFDYRFHTPFYYTDDPDS
jgi:hypothetical protein